MSGKGQAVPVTIFGQSYTLRTDQKPSYIQNLAEYVDGRMREVADLTRTADTAKIAILAALNIADELHRRGDAEPADEEIGRRVDRIEALLDGALA